MQYVDWVSLYRFQKHRFGALRGFIRTLRKDLRRTESRKLIRKYIQSTHQGLELGSGEQTIAPIRQTLLSDAYQTHAGSRSLAQQFFPAESIPFSDQTFDFIINEHVLEHLPDAIRGLEEWKRVLKKNGILILFLPHPERTFDRLRTITSIEHFFDDHAQKVTASEGQHWSEWNEKVIQAGLAKHYQPYSKEESLKNNLIHRHVFTPASTEELLNRLGWNILETIECVPDRTDSFAVVAKL